MFLCGHVIRKLVIFFLPCTTQSIRNKLGRSKRSSFTDISWDFIVFFVFVVVVVNRKFFITCSELEVSGINVYYLSKTYYWRRGLNETTSIQRDVETYYNVMALFGKLGEFCREIEGWQNYVERLEFFFQANSITDNEKKRAILLSSCGPEPYNLFRGLCAPGKPAHKSFDELVDLMHAHQHPKPNPIAERFMFNTRDRLPEESVSVYIASLTKLTEHCGYGEQIDSMLRDRLVCGINNERIQQRLLSEGESLTLKRVIEISQAMESAAHNSSAIQSFQKRQNADIHQISQGVIKSNDCFRCGGKHNPNSCRFKEAECFYCKKKGHMMRVCRKKAKSNTTSVRKMMGEYATNNVEEEESNEVENNEVFNLYHLGVKRIPPITVEMEINGSHVQMEVDTGASLSVMSENMFEKLGSKGSKGQRSTLEPISAKLRTYTGEMIEPLGLARFLVKYGEKEANLPVIVTPGSGPALLGRNWLQEFKLDWPKLLNIIEIKEITENAKLESLLNSYQEVFKDELGCMRDFKVNIKLKQNAKPHFLKARPVPYAIKNRIERELDRLVSSGVYQACNYSTWATPIVPVVKEDETIRICGDYKQTINKEAICDNYPVPKTEDLLIKLNGGEKFTKLDLAHAYQQLELDEDSKEYLTINTHKGLFKPTRLQFGVHSAAGIFQRCMEQRICHIPFTIVSG